MLLFWMTPLQEITLLVGKKKNCSGSWSSVVVECILLLVLFFFCQASCELWWQHWCPVQHTDVTSEASTMKENDECLPADTSSKVGVLLISPSDQVLMFGCAVNMAKDLFYPPCFLKAIYGLYLCVRPHFLNFIKDVWFFKHAEGWHVSRRNGNGPLLMETDNKSFDMKFFYLVVVSAAVLRGAEPISPSNGVYQPLCTHISNPWIKKKKKKIQSPNQQWEPFSFLSVYTVCTYTCTFQVVIAGCKKFVGVCSIDGRAIALAVVVSSILGPTYRHVCPWA